MLDRVIFSGDGSFAGFQNHEGVDTEQGCAWIRVLQEQLDRGLIGPTTMAKMPGWWTPDHEDATWSVAELIRLGHLKKK